MKAFIALFAVGLQYTVFAGTMGQLFHFENAIKHNKTCGSSAANQWSVEGSVTLNPGQGFFQPKLVVQAIQKLCSVDLTACSTEQSSAPNQECSCMSRTGNSYNIRVGSQITPSQMGMTVQAVLPGNGLFQNVYGATTIGKIPESGIQSSVRASYSMNDEEARDMIDEQTVTVCPFHSFTLEICVRNASSDAHLKTELEGKITEITGGSCIVINHVFHFEPYSTPVYGDLTPSISEDRTKTLNFEYKEPGECTKLYYIHFKGDRHCRAQTTPGYYNEETTVDTVTSSPQELDGVCPDTPRTVRTMPDGFDVLMDELSFNETWTIFQRRVSGRVDFFRPWDDYVNGFGDITDSYWLGLKKIHKMCNYRTKCELLVHLGYPDEPFGVQQRRDGCYYARYSHFWLGGPAKKFKLKVSGYSGSAGDSLVYRYAKTVHDNQPFSTYDKDHDNWPENNCAGSYHGAWWYNDCLASSLNGGWGRGSSSGIGWTTVTGLDSATFTEMKFRRHDS